VPRTARDRVAAASASRPHVQAVTPPDQYRCVGWLCLWRSCHRARRQGYYAAASNGGRAESGGRRVSFGECSCGRVVNKIGRHFNEVEIE